MPQTEIRICNARSHNLRGVDCRIPLGALTVITGVSGSGKSSLAFDTLYAEGQRRYVTSLSTYARQFLERLPRPEVDSISSLPPAIAIEQRNRVTNARSTVGSATEILDHLRLLFARIGELRCDDCDLVVADGSVGSVTERLQRAFAGQRLTLVAPLLRGPGESAEALRDRLAVDGFTRVFSTERGVADLVETEDDELEASLEGAELLIDRLALDALPDADLEARDAADGRTARLAEAVASAFARGDGEGTAVAADGERANFREGRVCDGCGRAFASPEPGLFSFNSPLGACAACQGFGRSAELDLDRVIPDPTVSLEDNAIAPFATPTGRGMQAELAACRRHKIPRDRPWAELSKTQRDLVVEGDDDSWYGVRGFFDWLEGRRYKVQARVMIARYRRFVTCGECNGARLRPEALAVRLAGHDIAQLSHFSIDELGVWLGALELAEAQQAKATRLMELLTTRLATASTVGLGYLALDRQVRTLSGGEAQRIQLASALGGGLTAALYVLDEPSIGLHPVDIGRLIDVLLSIRDQGNTVVVVEHAPEVLARADHVIDLGPGAGHLGGHLLVEGSLEDVRRSPESQTGRLLRGEFDILPGVGASPSNSRPRARRAPAGRAGRGPLRIVGAREHNLCGVDVEIPLGQLVVVTGVSGAGKSSLIRSVLVGGLSERSERREPAGACDRIEGAKQVKRLVVVDQTPAVRSPRSNPATVSKAFDGIRQHFAATREARAIGAGPGWFSFNVPGGRCDACEGSGEVVIDMQFLDDVRVPCEECGGARYRREVLDVRIDGRSIVDVLALTIDEAAEVFAEVARVAARLEPLRRVGLGYLRLGQPLSSLSGGEHQRVRLALALAEPTPGALYVLDEPTTGLHAADIQVLMRCLDELISQGGSVIVIEHNTDVIRRADHVIDMGPGGGPEGGRVVVTGTPAQVAGCEASYTGRALARVL